MVSDETIKQACMKVWKGQMSARGAAQWAEVSHPVILRALKNGGVRQHRGRPPALDEVVEQHIATLIAQASDAGFPFGMAEFQARIPVIAARFNIVLVGSHGWVVGFLTRNPSISLREAKLTTLARLTNMNRIIWNRWFTIYDEVAKGYEPEEIINCDDKGWDLERRTCHKVRLFPEDIQ